MFSIVGTDTNPRENMINTSASDTCAQPAWSEKRMVTASPVGQLHRWPPHRIPSACLSYQRWHTSYYKLEAQPQHKQIWLQRVKYQQSKLVKNLHVLPSMYKYYHRDQTHLQAHLCWKITSMACKEFLLAHNTSPQFSDMNPLCPLFKACQSFYTCFSNWTRKMYSQARGGDVQWLWQLYHCQVTFPFYKHLTNISLSDYYPLLQLSDKYIFVILLSPLTTVWQIYLCQTTIPSYNYLTNISLSDYYPLLQLSDK